ncbi:MAG: OmpP1/FadL family transporter [Legionellales bacterium]
MYRPLRTLVSTAVLSILGTSAALATGFSLYTEGNGSATGNFGAGVAAEATDASIGWFNPAGLVLIHDQQVVFGGVGVFPSSKLSGTSTFVAALPPPFGEIPFSESFNGIKSTESAVVPSFHYALPLGENATFGLSLVAPFGLSTDWGNASPVRYEATLTKLTTVTLSPELGGRLSDNFSIGAGLDLQFAKVTFNSIIGAPPFGEILEQGANFLDSLSYNKGTSYGVGFHAGVMGMFNDNHTRIGLNYQSAIKHKFNGSSRLTGPLASTGNLFAPDGLPSSTFTSDALSSNPMNLPEIVTLSAYQDLNETFALLGSVVYTGWHVFNNIKLNNVAAPFIDVDTGDVSNSYLDFSSPQNFKNTWRFALGGNYHVNNQWMLRVGGGFDQTPTNDTDRDVRLPDSNRWALSAGAHYQMRPNIGIDLGYTHLFGANTTIDRTDALGATSTYNVNAAVKSYADLVGAQLVWSFDKQPEIATK